MISNSGVDVDPSKIEAIVDWPRPQLVRHHRGFLGLARYYRHFVRGFTSIVAPLTDLLCKTNFLWNDNAQAAFDRLKKELTFTPTLALPNFDIPFTIVTDVAGHAMGAVLTQKK